MSEAPADLAQRLKQAIKVAKLLPGLLAEYSVYYPQHEDEVLRAFKELEELTDTPDVEAFVKTVLKGAPGQGTSGTAEPQLTLQQKVKASRRWDACSEHRERRHTKDMVELLTNIGTKLPFKRGCIPDTAKRVQHISGSTLKDLGNSLLWVQRSDTRRAAAAAAAKIYGHWKYRESMIPDRWKAGTYRQAMIGAPGTGKTATAERMLVDIMDFVGGAEDVTELFTTADVLPSSQAQLLQPGQELHQALQTAIEMKLQYRMDMGEDGNGRHQLEMGEDPVVKPQQSLALRYYYMMCREEGQRFDHFLGKLEESAISEFPRILGNLEARDVIQAARLAFEADVAALREHKSPLLFHLIFDEAQSGFEVDPSQRSSDLSNLSWFQQMMSAHNYSMRYLPDVVLLTLAGTAMDIAWVESSSSGYSKTASIPLPLLTQDQVQAIIADLVKRLSPDANAGVEPCDAAMLLGEWSGGNARHLACLLAAVAGGNLDAVSTRQLWIALTQGGEKLQKAPEQALNLINSRPQCRNSLMRWQHVGQGHLLQQLLGLAIPQREVQRRDIIKLEHAPRERCTYEVLEGCGVIALQVSGVLAPDVSDVQKYRVVLPPLVFAEWYKKCKQQQWFEPPDSYLYDMWTLYMSPENKELEDVTAIVVRLEVLRALLKQKTCRLQDLLPLEACHQAKFGKLELQVPQEMKPITILASHTSEADFRMQLDLAGAGGQWAFKGPGREPRVAWWIVLQTVEGNPFVLQGQSKCRTYSNTVDNSQGVQQEYRKRFKADPTLLTLFIYVTDSSVDSTEVAEADVLVIDKTKRPSYYTPFGDLRRIGMHLLAALRPTNKELAAHLSRLRANATGINV